MIKFTSIDQYRNAVRDVRSRAQYSGKNESGETVYDPLKPVPVLDFVGTVKLHGTNAAIVYSRGGWWYQSRERVLTLEQDNAGFMRAMIDKGDQVPLLVAHVHTWLAPQLDIFGCEIAIFGEWCGQGIQKGVAVSTLPKMFVVFAVKLNGEWQDISGLDLSDYDGIHNIYDFPVFTQTIDFASPELSQNRLVEITEGVEAECPVGARFGVSGVGEGVVWHCVTPGWSDIWFKVKGEKHSVTKVRTLAAVDVEAMESMNAFVDSVVTEARLEQGLGVLKYEMLKPFDMTSIGDFLRWVFNDVKKEESDTVEASGLDLKKLGGPISAKAKAWYIARLNAGGF